MKIFFFGVGFFGLHACSGPAMNTETQFINYETEGDTVPLAIRQSTLLVLTAKDGKIEDNRGTGTLVTSGLQSFVLTAGHVVLNADATPAKEIFVCRMVGNLGFIYMDYNKDIKSQGFCYPVDFKEGVKNNDADYAILSAPKVLSPLLKAAALDLDPKLSANDVLAAAGFGKGEGQGEFRQSGEDAVKQCAKLISEDVTVAEQAGCLKNGKPKEKTDFEASTIFWLRGGRMKVETINQPVMPKEDVVFSQTVVLSVLKKNGAQGSAGDSGMGWWKDGKFVGVHFAGNSSQGGSNSYFRLTSAYFKK